MLKLGVNIDHIATLRQARGLSVPDPVKAARICERSGADSIVCHLREDRRHIQDKDVYALRKSVKKKFNLEMATAEEIVTIALKIKPDEATLVPENRRELTTEGGLDVIKNKAKVAKVTQLLLKNGTFVSIFIAADKKQIEAASEIGAPFIEIHTGAYADAKTERAKKTEFNKIKDAVNYARLLGLRVNAGHGLDYDNVKPIAAITGIVELNIGFSIIAKSVFVGLDNAVREMKRLMK